MKKLESSLTNMALVLTIIAVVAGAALAAVNAVTAPQIEKINADNLAAGIKSVMGSDNITVADPQEKTATVAGKEKTFNIYNVTDASGASLGKAVQTLPRWRSASDGESCSHFGHEGRSFGTKVGCCAL